MKRFLRLAHPGHEVVLVTGAANAEVARGRARANADFMMATKSNDQKSRARRYQPVIK